MSAISYRNFTIDFTYDDYAESPNDWDGAILVSYYRDCYFVPDEFEGHHDDLLECKGIYPVWNKYKKQYEDYHVFRVNIYDHSGIVLSMGSFAADPSGWDTSSGWAFLLEPVSDNAERTKACAAAQGMIETWNYYLSGQVYCYAIGDENGDIIDTLSGIYENDLEYYTNEAKSIIDYTIKKRNEEARKSFFARKLIELRHHIPLEKRIAYSF